MTSIKFSPTGELFINGIKFSSKSTLGDLKSTFIGEKFEEIKNGRSQILTLWPDTMWMNYCLEYFAIEFNPSCKQIVFSFVGTESSDINSVADSRLAHYLQDIFSRSGSILSKSLLTFRSDSNQINVLYDIKLAALSVEVIFKT